MLCKIFNKRCVSDFLVGSPQRNEKMYCNSKVQNENSVSGENFIRGIKSLNKVQYYV